MACMMRTFVAVLVIAASFSLVGCVSPSSPTTTSVATPAPVPVPVATTVGPPPNVDPRIWMATCVPPPDGFNQVVRPTALHLDISSVGERSMFEKAIAQVKEDLKDLAPQIPIDLNPGGSGATFPVTVEPGVTNPRTGKPVAAWTHADWGADFIVDRGTIKLGSVEVLYDLVTLVKEIYRALGVLGSSPVDGLLASTAWNNAFLSPPERLAVLKHLHPDVKPGSICSAQ